MNYLKTHVMYLVMIGLLALGARYWLHEHDAKVIAEQSVKAQQLTIKDLQQEMTANDQKSQALLSKLAAQRVAVTKSPQAAAAAIPSLQELPLNVRPVPQDPSSVIVNVIPLAQTLTDLQMAKMDAQQCQADLVSEKKIVDQQTTELTVTQKKHGFWRTLWSDTKKVAIAGAIGYGLGKI